MFLTFCNLLAISAILPASSLIICTHFCGYARLGDLWLVKDQGGHGLANVFLDKIQVVKKHDLVGMYQSL